MIDSTTVRVLAVVLVLYFASDSEAQPEASLVSYVPLPTQTDAGLPTCARPIRNSMEFIVGFSKGQIHRFNILNKASEVVSRDHGHVRSLAVSSDQARYAAVVDSLDGQSLELRIGSIEGNAPVVVSRVALLPGEVGCTCVFSPNDSRVAFVVRMRQRRVCYAIVADCESNEVRLNFGPFDSWVVSHFDQDSSRLVHFVNDDLMLGNFNPGVKWSALFAFNLSDQEQRSDLQSTATLKIARLRKVKLRGRAHTLQQTQHEQTVAVLADLTLDVFSGLQKYFVHVDPRMAKAIGGTPISVDGTMLSMTSCLEVGSSTFVLSQLPVPGRESIGLLYVARDAESELVQRLDRPGFSVPGQIHVDRSAKRIAFTARGTGNVWYCELNTPEQSQWIPTSVPMLETPIASFFEDSHHHLAIIDSFPRTKVEPDSETARSIVVIKFPEATQPYSGDYP